MSKKKISVFEQLSQKYFKHTGESAELPFYPWLGAMGVGETDKDLQALIDDEEMWKDYDEDRKQQEEESK